VDDGSLTAIHLTLHEQRVLTEFLSGLRKRFGDRIAHVWLFGSKARGDSDAESDVDLLIVAHDGDDALRETVCEMAYALSLEHGVLLCEHVVSAWRFAQMRAREEPLYKSITREGIDLWVLDRRRMHRGEDAKGAGGG
jgi:predicted nucleotidyltransferase